MSSSKVLHPRCPRCGKRDARYVPLHKQSVGEIRSTCCVCADCWTDLGAGTFVGLRKCPVCEELRDMKVEPFGLGYVHMHTYGCTHVDYASTYALTCNKTTANGTTLCALHGGDAQLLNIRVARLEDLVVDLENRVSQQPAANAPPPPPPEPIATAQQPVTSPEVAQQPSPAPLPPSPFGSFVNTSPFDSFSFGSFAWQPPWKNKSLPRRSKSMICWSASHNWSVVSNPQQMPLHQCLRQTPSPELPSHSPLGCPALRMPRCMLTRNRSTTTSTSHRQVPRVGTTATRCKLRDSVTVLCVHVFLGTPGCVRFRSRIRTPHLLLSTLPNESPNGNPKT
jgi:hypothetical protein